MNRIKTTHVGSLPRPQEMVTKTLKKQDILPDDLRGYLRDIVDRQLATGIDYINNGELPRADYVTATTSRISGFKGTGVAPIPKDLEELPDFSRRFGGRNGLITLNPRAPISLPACTDPLSYVGEVSLREELDMMDQVYSELKPSYPDMHESPFFTSPSPGTVALFMANQYYPDYETYVSHIGKELKKEYDMIAGYGYILQIDCPDLAMGRHTGFKALSDEAFLSVMDINIQILNQALEGIDPGRCRIHVCWGNYAGTHHCDIELKEIISRIVKVNAGFISIEASNHRHSHEWTVFKDFLLPEDKVLMPGVIDTSSNIVEHPDLVARRILAFAEILGPERVVGSTDCGFATTASATSVSGEIAWLKLKSLVEGARRAESLL